MIPELREGLEQWFNEEVKERPELDEQRMEEINRLLTQAWMTGRQVVIRYWDNGEQEVAGRIVWFEMGKVRLVCENRKLHIDTEKIMDVIY